MRSIFLFRDLLARHMSKMPLPMHHAIRSPASLPRIVDTPLQPFEHRSTTRFRPPDLILSSDVKADLFRSVCYRSRRCDSYTESTHVPHMAPRLHSPAYHRFQGCGHMTAVVSRNATDAVSNARPPHRWLYRPVSAPRSRKSMRKNRLERQELTQLP